jgi:hypothetical protein
MHLPVSGIIRFNARDRMKQLTLIALITSLSAAASAQTGLTLYDGADFDANNNDIEDLGTLNSNSSNVTVNASYTNFANNSLNNISNIENFFNQTACADDEAIKTVYPNGSYACNSISTTTAAEGLPETLAANNTANQSIDLAQNGFLDTAFISGGGEAIQVNDDLNLGSNQIIFEEGNLSGGLEVRSDLLMNGNSIEELRSLNPSGLTTAVGGDLNIGGDPIRELDEARFTRGIEIGNEQTRTGTVETASNTFEVDTNTEWENNGTINYNLSIQESNLMLEERGDSYNEVLNKSLDDENNVDVEDVAVDEEGNYYMAGEGAFSTSRNVIKLDSSGTELWNYETFSSGSRELAVSNEGGAYLGQYKSLVKIGPDGVEDWSRSFSNTVSSVSTDDEGNVYAAGFDILRKYNSSGDLQWDYGTTDYTNGIAHDLQGNTYIAGSYNQVIKLDGSGDEIWSKSLSNPQDVETTGSGNILVTSTDQNYVAKWDSSGNEIWRYSYDNAQDVAVDSSGNIYVGGGNQSLVKLSQEGEFVWSYDYGAIINGVSVSDSRIAVGGAHPPGDLIGLENYFSYSDSGSYTSDVFDAGSVQPFPEFQASTFLPENTDANVTVSLSNNSDMSSSVSEKLEIGGGTESQIIDRNAQYAQFSVEMSGDTTDTPELDEVSIDYGNNAVAYGYNQIALGQGATTDAEGAVAIGYNASSNQAYTVRFGNEQGQELSAEVTGNLTLDGDLRNFFNQTACADDEAIKTVYPNGSYACNSLSTTTEAEGLSETLETNNTANQSINLSGNNLTEINTLNPNGNELTIGSNVTVGDGETSIAELNRLTDLPLQPTVDSFEDGDLKEYSQEGGGLGSSFEIQSDEVIDGSRALNLSATGTDDPVSTAGSAAVYSNSSLDSYPQPGQTFEFYTRYEDPNVNRVRFEFADNSSSFDSFYDYSVVLDERLGELSLGKRSGNTNFVKSDTVPVSISRDNWYRVEVDWKSSGQITATLFDTSSGQSIGEVSITDSEYDERQIGLRIGTGAGSERATAYFDGIEITDQGGLEIDSDVQLENNQLSNVQSIDGGGDSVNFNDNLNLENQNISNFFDQDQCASDEAIKTVLPNGSYVCNSISTTTEAENLSETLNAGNEAGSNNINLTGNNLTNVDTVKGSSPVKFADNINLTKNNITDVGKIEFKDAGGNILNVNRLSLSQGSSDFRLRVGGEKFLDEGFEDNSISPFSNDGDNVDWNTTSNTPFGDHAANADDTDYSEIAEMETTVSGGTLVVFKYNLDTGSPFDDKAFVETQSGRQKELGGTGGEWATGSLEVSPGSTQLEFVLRGGFSGSSITTNFRVDNIRVFNTTENAVTVYGSQSLNTGDFNQVNRINFVQGLEAGQNSNATNLDATAVGRNSKASGSSATALGRFSTASDRNAAALGPSSTASDTNAAALGPSSTASGSSATALGSGSTASAEDATALGSGSTASDNGAVALGRSSTASDTNAAALGPSSTASGSSAAALGPSSTASGSSATALGPSSTASSEYSLTLGAYAGQNSVEGQNAILIGPDPGGFNSPGGVATGDNSVGLGANVSATAPGAVAIGYNSFAPNQNEATFGNLSGQELDVNVTGNLTVHQSVATGSNTLSGLSSGDINASDIYYDSTIAKSPVVQCSAGSDWCEVSVPENQSSFFVKKSEDFDKDRPRQTAEEVIETDVDTVERFEELRERSERQEEEIQELNRTVQDLKSLVCEDNPGSEVCG